MDGNREHDARERNPERERPGEERADRSSRDTDASATPGKHDARADDGETIGFVRGAKDDDPDAWRALSDKIRAFLVREFGRERLAGSNDIDDLFAMVLVEFFEAIASFDVRSRGEFWAFIRTLARRRIVDLKRAARSQVRDERRNLPTGGEDEEGNPISRGELADHQIGTASQYARAAELGRLELDCLSRVPREEARTIYRLRRLETLTHEEIAARVGRKKAETVRWLYKDARDRVLRCLKSRLDDAYSSVLDGLSD